MRMKKTIFAILCSIFMIFTSGCYVQSKIMERSDAIQTAKSLLTCQTEAEIDNVLQSHIYGMLTAEDLYIILASAPAETAPIIASRLTPLVIDHNNIPHLYDPFIEEVKTAGLAAMPAAEDIHMTQYLGHIRTALNNKTLSIDNDLYSYVENILLEAPVASPQTPQTDVESAPQDPIDSNEQNNIYTEETTPQIQSIIQPTSQNTGLLSPDIPIPQTQETPPASEENSDDANNTASSDQTSVQTIAPSDNPSNIHNASTSPQTNSTSGWTQTQNHASLQTNTSDEEPKHIADERIQAKPRKHSSWTVNGL